MRAGVATRFADLVARKQGADSSVEAPTEPVAPSKMNELETMAKRGAGAVPQAVEQAAGIDHEEAQRIAKEAAAAVAAAEPLKLNKKG